MRSSGLETRRNAAGAHPARFPGTLALGAVLGLCALALGGTSVAPAVARATGLTPAELAFSLGGGVLVAAAALLVRRTRGVPARS